MHETLPLENHLPTLERLALAAPQRQTSRMPGSRRSAARGDGHEFAAYRQYYAGDDVRAIDWHVYARVRKPFVRLFQAEADRSVHLLLDTSNSMQCGHPDKLTYAKTVAMALSYVGVCNLDRVGLATFSDRLHDVMPPRRGPQQLAPFLALLNRAKPAGTSDFNRTFTQYAVQAVQPGVLVVLSDFFAPRGYEAGLHALLAHKFVPIIIHILAAQELHPPTADHVVLRDLEDGTATRMTIDDAVLQQYEANLQDFVTSLKTFCQRQRLPYVQLHTSGSFADLVRQLLQAGVWYRKCVS